MKNGSEKTATTDSTIERSNEAKSSTVKSAAEQAVTKAHQTVDRLSESAVRADDQLRGSTDHAQKNTDAQVDDLKRCIEKKPRQSADIAFAASLGLSRILR